MKRFAITNITQHSVINRSNVKL